MEEESFSSDNTEDSLMNLPSLFATTTTTDASMVTVTTTTTEIQPQQQQPQSESELNIWAARGLLLLVAAIWGTNFAVRFVIPLFYC